MSWSEYLSWRSAVSLVEQDTTNLSRSLVQHADDTLELTELPLAGLVDQMQSEANSPNGIAGVRQSVDAYLTASRRLVSFSIFDQTGQTLIASNDVVLPAEAVAASPWFVSHRQSSNAAALVSNPDRSSVGGQWIIPVSRRFNLGDGTFGGVVVAGINVAYLSNYYNTFETGSEGAINLISGSGILLARSPLDNDAIGRDLSTGELFQQHLRIADEGHYRYISPIDGVARIGGFQRSWKTQFTVLTAVSESEALADWLVGAVRRWIVAGVLLVAAGLLGMRLADQIARRHKSEQALAQKEEEFRLLTEKSSDMVERFNEEGVRQYVSPASKRLLGIEPEKLLGTTAIETVHVDDRADVIAAANRIQAGLTNESVTFRALRGDGQLIWLETAMASLPPDPDSGKFGVVAVTRDVTLRKELESKLAAMATVDGLTGIANRRAFDERLSSELARAQREGTPLSLLMIDADHFKDFNDAYGHVAGDKCLRTLASTIEATARRPGDLVGRFGGEEIAVVLPNTTQVGAEFFAGEVCSKIAGLRIPHGKNQPWDVVTVSIGVATVQTQNHELVPSENSFIEAADLALYRAKREGRNQVASALSKILERGPR